MGEQTRTIKVYESSARLIERMMSRKGTGATFADVFEDIMVEHYGEALEAMKTSADVVDAALDKVEAKRKKGGATQ